MSPRRAARTLREMGEELIRKADELDAAEAEEPKRPRRIVPLGPPRPPNEIEQARADASLRRLGYKVKP